MQWSLRRRWTLGLKLGAIIALCVVATIGVAGGIFLHQTNQLAREQARTYASEAAAAIADKAGQRVEADFRALGAAADALAALRQFDPAAMPAVK